MIKYPTMFEVVAELKGVPVEWARERIAKQSDEWRRVLVRDPQYCATRARMVILTARRILTPGVLADGDCTWLPNYSTF